MPNLQSNFAESILKFNPFPWLSIIVVMFLALWARFHLVEQNELGFFCDGGGGGSRCQIRWLIVQSFNTYGLGYFGLFLGVLATVTRSALAGFAAAAAGMAGLVLYTWDYSALAFLLGILALARAQLEDYRYQHRAAQKQT